jgi:predicted nucleotidyltransferase
MNLLPAAGEWFAELEGRRNSNAATCAPLEQKRTRCLSRRAVGSDCCLFGSLARGQADHMIDVDIAVLLEAGLEPKEAVERQVALAMLLDPCAEAPVQVTLLNSVAPALAYQVIAEGILLSERNRSARIEFEVRAMQRHSDPKPMLEYQHQMLLKRIREGGLGRRKNRTARPIVEKPG